MENQIHIGKLIRKELDKAKSISIIGIENCKWAYNKDVKKWLKLINKKIN